MNGQRKGELSRCFLCPHCGLDFHRIFPRLAAVGSRQQLQHKPIHLISIYIISPLGVLSDSEAGFRLPRTLQ